jgi:DNA-binding beta-propeller fold protein YncE
MKRKYAIYAIICMSLLVLSTCNTNPNETIGKNRITMTTSNKVINLYLVSEGDVRINWGDNRGITDKRLFANGGILYQHTYRNRGNRDISIYGDITYLDCSSNGLTRLNIRNCTALETLYCNNNKLASLDISKNARLQTLFAGNTGLIETMFEPSSDQNAISKIDTRSNPALESLYLGSLGLRNLDVSNNPSVRIIDISHNMLTATELNRLFHSLHTNVGWGKTIRISRNPGTDDCDVSIAEAKGWQVIR